MNESAKPIVEAQLFDASIANLKKSN